MADYGFIDGQLVIPTTTQIIDDINTRLQQEFGENYPTTSNTRGGQFTMIQAEREYNVWEMVQMVQDTQTINGAEGIFLDEIFNRRGIPRVGSTAGSVNPYIEVNNSCPDTEEIKDTYQFSAANGQIYKQEQTITVEDNVGGYKLLYSMLVSVGNYSFQYTDLNTQSVYTYNLSLPSLEQSQKETFLGQLETSLQNHTTSVNLNSEGLFVGFDEGNLFIGAPKFGFQSSPSIGNRFILCAATNTKKGYYPIPAFTVNSVNPVPTGYVSVVNPTAGSSGSNPETDAAYRIRALSIANGAAGAATREAIIANVLKVAGVSNVKINKQIVDTGNGTEVAVVTPLVIGGETQAIAEAIYLTQPVDAIFQGNVSATVETGDGDTEEIHFSRGSESPLDIKIEYSTEAGNSLSEVEKSSIVQGLLDLSAKFSVGTVIFNTQLQSPCFAAVSYGRYKSLEVFVKKVSDPDSSYSNQNYQPSISELPTLNASNIYFVRV